MFTGFMGGVPGAEGWRRCIMHYGGRFDVVYQQLAALQIVGDGVEYFGGPGGVWGCQQGLTGDGGHHCHVFRKCQERGPQGVWCHIWVGASDVKRQREADEQEEEWPFRTPLRDSTGGVHPWCGAHIGLYCVHAGCEIHL